MPQFQWLTFVNARAQLAQRLADAGNSFWTDAENGIYITEALRMFNALTATWNQEFTFNAPANPGQIWYGTGRPGYPRVRTITDTYVYTEMEYHLLEPPSGGTWTGTPQFNITQLSTALQNRRDEVLQYCGVNFALAPIAGVPNVSRTALPDTTLEVIRVRFVPGAGWGNPVTLWRADAEGWTSFEPGFPQNAGNPIEYAVITGPPLMLDVDNPPVVPGSYEVLTINSGPAFSPPTATLLTVPDDFYWVPKWGAMSDLLGRESEATDIPRAQYCLNRYQDGMKVLQKSPWLTLARLNNVTVDTPSVFEMDSFAAEWDSNPNAPQALVTAGIDIFAASPNPNLVSNPVGITMTVIANAPVPVADGDFVQIARDQWDAVLDYAQHLACFKQGGQEFQQTIPLAGNFLRMCMNENSRLAEMGLFRDILLEQGQRQDEFQPRYAEEGL